MKLFSNFPVFFYTFIACLLNTGYTYPPHDSNADGPTPSQLATVGLMFFPHNRLDNFINVLVSDAAEMNDYIDDSKPTVIYVSGWTENITWESVHTVLGAYFERGDHNVILVNYDKIAALDYWHASSSVEAVGHTIATALNSMVNDGMDSSTLHLVGHSLGGQVIGAIGKNVDFELPRIVGLDPARLHFEDGVDSYFLTATDAKQVMVIHTDAGGFGVNSSDGSVNFWPNGGTCPQPGCGYNDMIAGIDCCHRRSWQYYAESLSDEDAFIGVQCESWELFKTGACSSNPTAVMGFATPPSTSGEYYLQTNSCPPYGLGETGETYVE